MKKHLGSFVLACSLSLPVAAGHVFKVRGKLKSYSDKDITIINTLGKKQKIPFSRLVLDKKQDLSKMLNKESTFYFSPDFEPLPQKRKP